MDFQKQHPQHQSYPRSSLFAASRDPDRPGPPPSLYEPSPSALNGSSSHQSYESLSRRDNEMPRPFPYNFPSSSYSREKTVSQSPFASLRADATNGYHSQLGSHRPVKRHISDGGMKDNNNNNNNMVYRDGRGFFFFVFISAIFTVAIFPIFFLRPPPLYIFIAHGRPTLQVSVVLLFVWCPCNSRPPVLSCPLSQTGLLSFSASGCGQARTFVICCLLSDFRLWRQIDQGNRSGALVRFQVSALGAPSSL